MQRDTRTVATPVPMRRDGQKGAPKTPPFPRILLLMHAFETLGAVFFLVAFVGLLFAGSAIYEGARCGLSLLHTDDVSKSEAAARGCSELLRILFSSDAGDAKGDPDDLLRLAYDAQSPCTVRTLLEGSFCIT
jgi:hypothetical protein